VSKRLKPSDVLRIARTFGDPWEGAKEDKKTALSPSIQKLREVAGRIKPQIRK